MSSFMDPPKVVRSKRQGVANNNKKRPHEKQEPNAHSHKKQRTLLDYFGPAAPSGRRQEEQDANQNHVLVGSSSSSSSNGDNNDQVLPTEVLFQNVLKCLTVKDITVFSQTCRAAQRLVHDYRGPLPYIIREELQEYKLQYVNLVDRTHHEEHSGEDHDDSWVSHEDENESDRSPRQEAHRRFFEPQSNEMRRQQARREQQQAQHQRRRRNSHTEEDDDSCCSTDAEEEDHPLDHNEVSRCRTVRFLLKTKRHRVVEVHLKFGVLLWTEMVDVVLDAENPRPWVEVKVYRQVKEGDHYRRIQLFENVVTYHDDLGSIQYYLEGVEQTQEELAVPNAAVQQVLALAVIANAAASAAAASADTNTAASAAGRIHHHPNLVTHNAGSSSSMNNADVHPQQHFATSLVRVVDQVDFSGRTTTTPNKALPLPSSLATESNQRDVVSYVYTCAQRIAQKSPAQYNFPNLHYTLHQALAPPLRQCYLPSHHYGGTATSAVPDQNDTATAANANAAAALAAQGPPRAEASWLYRKPPCLAAKRDFMLATHTKRDQHGQLTFEFPIHEVPWYGDWYLDPAKLAVHPRRALQSMPKSIVQDSILSFLDDEKDNDVVEFLKQHCRRGD